MAFATDTRYLYMYLHTHWDREWYRPFETFRAELLPVVKQVLSGLESGDLPCFYLDGQASLLEDALELAPELAPRIKALMKSGKLTAGPWYVLADEMLVCGESLIRNLKKGLSLTSLYGKPEMVGYSPDTFGHTQDLPRILCGFKIDSAFVWRGVPDLASGPSFIWRSPDGSEVLAYHLAKGYYQTQFHEEISTEALADNLLSWVDAKTPRGAVTFDANLGGGLVPVGGDHLAPPDYSGKARDLKSPLSKGGCELKPIGLRQFADLVSEKLDGKRAKLSIIAGELRCNQDALKFERAYMLQGVLSSRLYLKRANRVAEQRLINRDEPLLAVLSACGLIDYPGAELDRAWTLLLRNHPHDSICGCSVDDVHSDMIVRYRGVHQILDTLERRVLAALANGPAFYMSQKIGVVDPAFEPNQLIVLNSGREAITTPIRIQWAEELSDSGRAKQFFGDALQITSQEEILDFFAPLNGVPIWKKIRLNTGWLATPEVPALGRIDVPWLSGESTKANRVTVHERMIENESLSVEVSASGDIIVKDPRGTGRSIKHFFRDVGDGGDSYNFDPIIGDKAIVSKFESVEVGAKGPLVASLILKYKIEIPLGIDLVSSQSTANETKQYSRSKTMREHELTTEISIASGSPIVQFETHWTNQSCDHRLEVVFDTGAQVTETFSENSFSVVKRSSTLTKVDLPVPAGHEAPLDRYPAQRFFIANDQLFLNHGLPEYAVDGSCVSMTILRAFSELDRDRLITRGGGAGPHYPTPDGNCIGPNQASYAYVPLKESDSQDWQLVTAYRIADKYLASPIVVFAKSGKNTGDSNKQFIEIDNPAIRLTSCLMNSKLFLRLLNVTNSEQSCKVKAHFPIKDTGLFWFDESKQSSVVTAKNSFQLQFSPNQLLFVGMEIERS